jgi:hypothetical protein
MAWEIVLLDEVDDWFLDLARRAPQTAAEVEAAIDMLAIDGPATGRPLVDRIKDSGYHNLKELRPTLSEHSTVRILFIFDPARQAVLLVAGDKAGNWKGWYKKNIPVAERRYKQWLKDGKD